MSENNNVAPRNGEKRERATVEVNTNGKKLTFDLGNIITIIVMLVSLAGTWVALGSQVEQNTKDIERLQTNMTTAMELARDNAAILRGVSVAIEKNAEAINSLRTGWNNYATTSSAENTQVRESLAAIRAQLDAMAKQIDKLNQ